jgi:hypothetical protein
MRSHFIPVLGTLCLVGCGGASDLEADGGACNVVVASHPIEGATHVPDCSPLTFETNPPSSGNHYQEWGAFGVYEAPLPRGNWVHNLEHGSVVFTYNCPDGCDDEIESAKAMLSELAPDPGCGASRVLLVPDPKLDVTWAASAWGYNLRSDCLDEGRMKSFFKSRIGKGPEAVCAAGTEFRNPDGTLTVAAGCGD